MRTTRQFSITLPDDMAVMVQRKVESGDYASASEVMREGLRALQSRDAVIERWLREEVVPSYEKYLSDPSTGIPAQDVLARIQARYAADNEH